jgi:hypothetical protein
MQNVTNFSEVNSFVAKFEDHKQTLSEREQTIKWLQLHNYPALPVAPAQSAYEYHKVVQSKPEQCVWQHCPLTADRQPIPLYTGKNPSYLDESGTPHLVNHSDFQKRLPFDQELKTWFANPANGVGTLGGWNNTVWLDFDLKQFEDKEQCTAAALQVAARVQQQTGLDAFLEESHSGGWRVGVRVRVTPNFTNFALEQGGKHVGEALGMGRFTVLAPTIGPSGNPYKSHQRCLAPMVESLESIGIYSVKAPSTTPEPTQRERKLFHKGGSGIPSTILLEDLGNNLSREILSGACPTGDRSEALATAIQEWYGWENWCNASGVCYSGNTAELAHIAGAALGMTSDRVGRILNPAQAFVPSQCQPAALVKGGEESCWKKIYRLDKASFEAKCPGYIKDAIKQEWRRTQKEGRGGKSNGCGRQGGCGSGSGSGDGSNEPLPLTEVSLPASIKEIMQRYDKQSLRDAALMNLASGTGYQYRDIDKLAKVIEFESALNDDAATAAQSLAKLLKTRRTNLNPHDYFESWFASLLQTAADAMPTAVEFLITTLLPVAAACIGTSSRVVVKPSSGYVQPLVIWSAIVGQSGDLKTPAQKAIINPLIDLEMELKRQYERELEEWESKQENRGKRPVRQRLVTKDATLETLQRIHGANPRGLLYYRDELAGGAKSRNQYRGGFGADLEAELDQFNGSAIIYDRGDKEVAIASSCICRTGGYQWEVAAQMMTESGDFSGYNARWNLCAAKAPKPYIDLFSDDADRDTGLTDALGWLYRQLRQVPHRDYLLSYEAKVLFQAFQHQSVDEAEKEDVLGLQVAYPKNQSYVARFALLLHIVNATLRGESPEPTISGDTMQQAIDLAGYYLWQYRMIYKHNKPDSGIEGMALKLHRWACKKGQVTASQVKAGISDFKKMVTDAIRSCFQSLASSGWGRTEGEGEKMVYIPADHPQRSIDAVDSFLTKPSIAQTTPNLGLDVSIDKIDEFDTSHKVGGDACELSHKLESVEQNHQFINLESDPPANLELEAVDASTQPSNQTSIDDGSDPDDEPDPPEPGPGGGVVEKNPSTLQELQALLLACQSLTELERVQSQYKEQAIDAYRAMSLDNQLKVDGLTAARYNFPIYKYVGEWRLRNCQTLRHGDLVRLKSSKKHLLVGVLPLDCCPGEEEQRVIDVSPKHLVEVSRYEGSPQGDQLSFA